MNTKKHKIVILGGGFGGVYAYLELHRQIHKYGLDLHLTLISNSDHFLFVPLIHEVAVGNLVPSSVKQPIRLLPKCCMNSFVLGEVKSIDLDKRSIACKRVNSEDEIEDWDIPYDFLINALGADTNFFGTPGADRYALTLKTLEDAKKIKNTIVENFEQAQGLKSEELMRDALRVVIVGGGPTGVELAGELSDLISKELKQSFPLLAGLCEVVLIQRVDRLIPQMDQWFSDKVCRILKQKGVVTVMKETSVERIQDDGVQTTKGFIHSHSIIWTAGIQARQIPMVHDREIESDERSKRIKVSNHLHIDKYPEVFVIGDQAWVYDKEHEQGYPQRAQFAVREGVIAGRNIIHMINEEKLEEFHWKDQGFIISLGKGGALADIYGVKISGFFAWWLYRTAYISKLIGWRTKIRAIVDWTLNLFLPRDISKY